ncbi:MAG: hypothetical protein U5L05_00840 [Rubrivivax sp.]|nr:hypothetical protein [Rubrivivax sp.]
MVVGAGFGGIAADLVISNADAASLYPTMVPRAQQAWSARLKLKTARYSMGLFVLYFGTRKQYPEVAHHTLWLGERDRVQQACQYSSAVALPRKTW